MGKKTQLAYLLSTKDPPQNKRFTQVESEWREKKIFEANRHEKKAGLVILISDKTVFKTKDIKSDTEGQYIILKGLVQQEDINP